MELLRAASSGNPGRVREILGKGADVNWEHEETRESALYVASGNGHTEVANLLLQNGAQVDLQINTGASPLYIGSQNGHTEVANLLLLNDAQVNLQKNNGWTPLHIACLNGHTEVANLLLENGAQVNLQENDGWSPLHIVSHYEHIEVANLLLQNGAQVNLQINTGASPLYIGSQNGHTEVANLLLQNDAQVNLQKNNGWSPLHITSQNGHTEVANLLLQNGAQVNLQINTGESPLYIASQNGRTEVANLLLQNGAQVNLQINTGESPLYIASQNGHTEVANLLLQNGAQVNLQKNKGWSPLHIASQNGHTEVANLLLQNGAQLDLQENSGLTLLHTASLYGHTEVANLLLQNGAQVNLQENNGWSPLHFASLNGHNEVANLLLQNGAQVDQQKNNGWSPLNIASLYGRYEVANLLLQNGAQVNLQENEGESPLYNASRDGHTEVANLLLRNGAQVNQQKNNGWSPLHLASLNGRNEVTNLLLQNGAQVNLQENGGWSPLYIASQNGHTEVANLLLQNGAQVNLQTNDGCSPLHIASQNGHTEGANLLLQNDAEVNLQTNDGWSPLCIASQSGHTEVAKLLLQKGAQVNLPNNDGLTALLVAHDSEMQKILQSNEHGEDMKEADEKPLSEDRDASGTTYKPKDDVSDHDSTDEERELQKFTEGIEEAIARSRKIDRKLANIMFVGPTGSGKSSLMNRLLGRLRKVFSASTGVCEDIVVVDIDMPNPTTLQAATVLEGMWKEIECEASFVGQLGEESISTSEQKEYEEEVIVTSKANNPLEAPVQTVGESTKQEAVSISTSSFHESTSLREVPPIYLTIHSIIKKYGYKTFENYLKKTCSLYLRDTGGQVEFQEMLALLTFGPSIFFFVFRADLDFKSKYEVEYRKSEDESLNCYTSSITTEEALLQSLASVYAMDTSSEDIIKTHQPLVFIVGTHIDMLVSEREAKISSLNQHLNTVIKSNGFSDMVQYADEHKVCVMFTVDNNSENDESFQLIRSRVNSLVIERNIFNIEYPISYLLFCLDLQNIKKSILTLEECHELAAIHGVAKDQVPHLLQFLQNRIGLIRYFNVEGLCHIVVKDPQVLFNGATDLVVRTFSSKSLTTAEARDLKQKGIISLSMFESVASYIDEISPKVFLNLLVHLRIAVPFEERYFFPCVLNHVPESTEEDPVTDVAPLCIKFKYNHCPKGIYGVLVTHLMRPERDGHNTSFTLLQEKIFKDQVSFEVHSDGALDEVCLKIFSSHIEVKFFPELSEFRTTSVDEVCDCIRRIMENSILSSLKDLHYQREKVGPEMCFKCEHCSELHPVVKRNVNHLLHCRKSRNRMIRIPTSGRYWYKEEGNIGHTSNHKSSQSSSVSSPLTPPSPPKCSKSSISTETTSSLERSSSSGTGSPSGMKPCNCKEWELNTFQHNLRGKDTIIAVIDSGVCINYDFLRNRTPGYDIDGRRFVRDGDGDDEYFEESDIPKKCLHGTLVASIIGGHSDPEGYGIAPDANIYVCRVTTNKENELESNTVEKALEHILNLKNSGAKAKDIDIVCMSLGFNKNTERIEQLLRQLADKRVVLVAAAGNDGKHQKRLMFPASDPNVISVGFLDKGGCISNLNPPGEINLYLPGENFYFPGIVSDDPLDGSSFATAMLAGLLSLIIQWAKNNSKSKAVLEKYHDAKFLRLLLRDSKLSRERGEVLFVKEFLCDILERSKDNKEHVIDCIRKLYSDFKYN